MIGGPWNRSMKGCDHGPSPWRGSMDQESVFCTFPQKTVLQVEPRQVGQMHSNVFQLAILQCCQTS